MVEEMRDVIRPLDLLYELTDWCIQYPNATEIKKYQINKMIRNATEQTL